LTLAGLAGVRQRAKIDKTRSTIRKLHEIVVPQYESYVRRRVAYPTGRNPRINAENRLISIRELLVREMPDAWGDVFPSLADVPPEFQTSGPVRAYAAFRGGLPANVTATYGSSECLHMIVAFGGADPAAMEMFRADEIGDIDGDGAPEFHDGWGRPIAFFRWATGFRSPIQGPGIGHDAFDPLRLEPDAFSLTPLIFSGGPDEALNDPLGGEDGYALERIDAWLGPTFALRASLATIFARTNGDNQPPGTPKTTGGSVDNITNHDMVTK
jgi:hypothetical protein